jgi:hypothetical protein
MREVVLENDQRKTAGAPAEQLYTVLGAEPAAWRDTNRTLKAPWGNLCLFTYKAPEIAL